MTKTPQTPPKGCSAAPRAATARPARSARVSLRPKLRRYSGRKAAMPMAETTTSTAEGGRPSQGSG